MSRNQATERVVVGVSGSVANLAALHAGVEAARRLASPLVAVLAWVPVGGELAYRRAPCPLLLRVWHNAARDRLGRAFNDAFGGLPDDVAIEGLVIRGDAGLVLTRFADHPSDLLIVGAGRRLPWLHGVRRYCLRHARCPVQIVEPPAMIHELRNRRWVERELRETMINPAR
jgi:nucleotide-binding universal stress UspA family protein